MDALGALRPEEGKYPKYLCRVMRPKGGFFVKRLKKRALSLLMCLCLCLGVLPAGALAASTVSVQVELTVDYDAAYEELDCLNEVRREAGLSELVMDEAMMDMALRRAVESAVYFNAEHTRPDGQTFDTARPAGLKGTFGENLSYGTFAVSAAEATQSWYDSPGHRANMLNGVFSCVGIACVRDLRGQTYWVQEFYSGTGTPEATPSSGTESLRFTVEADPAYLTVQLIPSSLALEIGEKEVVYVCTEYGTPIVPTTIRSSDEGVARLSMEDGGVCVEAVSEGDAVLTLGFGGKSAEMTVSVAQTYADLPTELMILKPEGGFRVKVGEELPISVTFRPRETAAYGVFWFYDETGPFVVDSPSGHSAVLVGQKPGTGTLQVFSDTLPNGETLTTSVEITVYDDSGQTDPDVPAAAEEIDLSAYYMELIPGEQVRLHAYVRPNGADQDVTWTSKDPSVATVDQNGRVTGVTDGGVTNIIAATPDGEVSGSCQVQVTASYLGTPISFTDVKEGDYCYNAAAWATAQNLVMAPFGGKLGAAEDCTRMEIVRYLWQLMGSPQPEDLDNQPFTDVSNSLGDRDDRWAIQWAVEADITTGTSDTTFSPDMTVTRAQAVTFLHRAAGLPGASGGTGFTDVLGTDWFADAAVWAVQEGITNGTGGNTFTPDRVCSRGEILTFLYRQFG